MEGPNELYLSMAALTKSSYLREAHCVAPSETQNINGTMGFWPAAKPTKFYHKSLLSRARWLGTFVQVGLYVDAVTVFAISFLAPELVR